MNWMNTNVLLAVAVVAGLSAEAEAAQGLPLAPIATLRGPFRSVVVGGSVVASDGQVGIADAVVDLPANAQASAALLLWSSAARWQHVGCNSGRLRPHHRRP
jgi:hypothetical protein